MFEYIITNGPGVLLEHGLCEPEDIGDFVTGIWPDEEFIAVWHDDLRDRAGGAEIFHGDVSTKTFIHMKPQGRTN